MSLLTDASLIVTPNGYNKDKLYSVIPNTTLGDMDVSRGSSATRVNSAGLIEIARTNLVLYSEQFDNAYWTKVQGGIALAPVVTPNVETAPDGTTTADRVVFNLNGGTASGDLSSLGSGIFTSVSITRTQSVWIKTTDGTTKVFSFISPTGALTPITVTSVYQRFTWTSTGINVSSVRLRLRGGEGTATSATIAIWGAQYEDGSVATEYIPTVASIRTKFAGITQDGGFGSNIPRIDYPTLGGCPSILVEPARTNLVLYSEQFTNVIWDKGATISLVSNTTETASPQGINNATKATANGTGFIFIRQNVFPTTTLPTTNSIFVKKANNRYVGFRNGGSGTLHDVFDFNTETWTNNSGSTLSFDKLINDWYRLKSSRTNTLVNNYTSITIPSNTSGNETETVSNLTLYLWGGQSELNVLNATSYIPTTTAAVPRDADVIRNLSATTLIGQTEGTLYAEINITTFNNGVFFSINDGTAANRIQMYKFTDNKIYCDRISATQSGTTSISSSALSVGTYKVAFAYQSGNSYLYINGTQVGATSAATFTFGSMGKVNIGSRFDDTSTFNDRIKLATLFKTRLTDDQCILLTGPSFSSYPEMANNFPNTLIYSLQ